MLSYGYSQLKQQWLGSRYLEDGPNGNEITKTNVPNIRLSYRQETLQAELALLQGPMLNSSFKLQ